MTGAACAPAWTDTPTHTPTCVPVSDASELRVQLRASSWVESIRVKVQGARLEGAPEHIRHACATQCTQSWG